MALRRLRCIILIGNFSSYGSLNLLTKESYAELAFDLLRFSQLK